MSANVAQFFDSSLGHTTPATFKTGAGVTIRTVDVIFTKAAGALEEVGAEAAFAFIECKLADLAGVDHSCKVVIGNTTYRITRDANNGSTAMVLLQP